MNALLLTELVVEGLSPDVAIGLVCESVSDEELVRTALALVKSNNGNWKSEKQGLFLLDSAKAYSTRLHSHDSSNAKDWLSKKGYDTSKLIAVAWYTKLKGYGRTDPSKIRYAGTVLAFDEKGVVFVGNVKVTHPKGEQQQIKMDWLRVTPKYERPKAHQPTVVVNYFNKPYDKATIDLIRSIPDYQDHEILLSFLNQLRDGRQLSPKQKVIINKFLPKPKDIGLGSNEQLQKDLETFYQLVRTKFIPLFADHITKYDLKALKWRSILDEWRAFSKGAKYEHGDTAHFVRLALSQLLNDVSGRPKKLYQQDFLHWMRDKVRLAIKTKSPGKAHVEAVEALRWLNKTLEAVPVSKIKSYYELD